MAAGGKRATPRLPPRACPAAPPPSPPDVVAVSDAAAAPAADVAAADAAWGSPSVSPDEDAAALGNTPYTEDALCVAIHTVEGEVYVANSDYTLHFVRILLTI